MTEGKASAVTLRALEGEPLAHEATREMVIATAHAIAERQGVPVFDVKTTPTSVTVVLGASRIVAMGFAAELRRLTTAWFTRKFGVDTLWGEPPPSDATEPDDQWWRGS